MVEWPCGEYTMGKCTAGDDSSGTCLSTQRALSIMQSGARTVATASP